MRAAWASPYDDAPMRLRQGRIATAFYRDIVIRGYETVYQRRRIFPYWRELERTQWLRRDQLEDLQLEALRRLVRHAEDHCPWYRDTWRAAGLGAENLKTLADLARWPLVRRATIREHRAAMRATAPAMRLIPKATGGSSGEPLHFDLDSNSNDRRMAAWLRGYSWAGAGPGTKQFYLWGAPVGDVPEWKRWKLRLYDAVYRRRLISSFGLSDATVPVVFDQLARFRPDVVVAYTNPLYFFARSIRERGLKPPSIRSIVVGAEKLHDFQRRVIEGVFNCPVFETYGSREFMMMAGECDRHEGLHLTFEQLLLEVVDDEGHPVPDGAEGDVAVTDLHNFGMPFIRYLNGDRAIAGFGNCSCGRGLPTLRKVTGRRLDIVYTPDGRRVPGEFFPHLLKEFAAVRHFQVVQETPRDVRLRLVLGEPRASTIEALRQAIGDVLGPEALLTIEVVDEIPLSRSGKLQVVVNRLLGRESNGEPG